MYSVFLFITRHNLNRGFVEPLVQQGNSFGAFDASGELCGTCIVDLLDNEERAQYKRNSTEQEMKKHRICDVLTGGDVKSLLTTDKVWELKYNCVAPRHKGPGVIQELVKRALILGAEKGCRKMIRYTAHNPDVDRWGRPFRLISYRDYFDPETGKKEFEGLMPRYTHHCLHVDEVSRHVAP